MKKTLLILGLAVLAFSACQEETNTERKAVELNNAADSFSYFYGILIGSELQMAAVEDANFSLIESGLVQGATSDSSIVDPRFAQFFVMNYFNEKETAKFLAEQTDLENWIKENRDFNEVTKAEEGYYYRVLQAADGANPKINDVVEINYTGKLLDGTVFDSTKDKDPLKLGVSQFVKGFSYGLQQMSVGSKYEFYIPASLAYGPAGAAGGLIAPNSSLVFEVELLSIVQPEG